MPMVPLRGITKEKSPVLIRTKAAASVVPPKFAENLRTSRRITGAKTRICLQDSADQLQSYLPFARPRLTPTASSLKTATQGTPLLHRLFSIYKSNSLYLFYMNLSTDWTKEFAIACFAHSAITQYFLRNNLIAFSHTDCSPYSNHAVPI